jgi:hypothetical protein
MLNALRWLLVPISTAFGCWFGIALAVLLHSAFTSLCPAGMLVSGLCHASWFPAAEAFAQYSGAALGAALAVLLPYLLAPSHKRIVAVVAFLLGAAYAAAFVVAGLDAWPYAACAIVSGLIVLVKTRPRAAH